MAQDGEAVLAQGPRTGRGEQRVGEHAAGEGDGVRSVPLSGHATGLAYEAGDGPVEACGDDGRGDTRPYVVDDRREYGRGVGGHRSPAVGGRGPQGEGVCGVVPGLRVQRCGLQFDGRLGFVSGVMADTRKGGDGVEEAPHTGGGYAVEAALQLALQYAQFVRRAGGGTRQVGRPADARRVQVRKRHAVRPLHRGVAARQRDVGEVTEPDEPVVVGQQNLPAPHRAVVAVAGAVEGDADHRTAAVEAVFGHRRRDMGVMVLDVSEQPAGRMEGGPPTGAVAGMPVGRKQFGSHPGDRLQLRLGALERLLGGQVVHVPDVSGQPGSAPLRESEDILQISPDGEGRPHGYRQRERQGAYPRARRTVSSSPSHTRTTESSHGTWMRRSWTSQASATCASRSRASSSSVTIGSPARLPLVMTSRRGPSASPGRPSSRW